MSHVRKPFVVCCFEGRYTNFYIHGGIQIEGYVDEDGFVASKLPEFVAQVKEKVTSPLGSWSSIAVVYTWERMRKTCIVDVSGEVIGKPFPAWPVIY